MKINILHLIDGAKAARGSTVIIDVFRAFSVEAYLLGAGAERVIPVGSIEAALKLKEKYPDALLCGERGGAKIDGFDYGNSPSELKGAAVCGRVVIHTTSAGTQGVENAKGATEIIGGSLVCAKAIADYLLAKRPDEVSLVAMGLSGERDTDEDILCAEYIKSRLLGAPLADMESRVERLKETDGKKFFAPENAGIFPREDFTMCTRLNAFPFIVRLHTDADGTPYMQKIDTTHLQHRPGRLSADALPDIRPGDRISKFTEDEVYSFTEDMQAAVVYTDEAEAPSRFDYAVVLGGEESFIPSRAAAAARLYREGKCSLFFVSGGVFRNTAHGFITEADALRLEMTALGVPEDAIISENAAATTIENMTLSHRMAKKLLSSELSCVAIVTSRFHCRRATYLAKSLIKDARVWGISADYPLDNPAEFKKSPLLSDCVEKECRLLHRYVAKGLIEDFEI